MRDESLSRIKGVFFQGAHHTACGVLVNLCPLWFKCRVLTAGLLGYSRKGGLDLWMKDLEREVCNLWLVEDSGGETLWTFSYHLPLICWWLPTQRWAINIFQGSNKQLRPHQGKAAEIRVKSSEMTLHFRRTSWKNPRWREILGRTGMLQAFQSQISSGL